MSESNKLSKFEKTRLLGARTLQISENAPFYIKTEGETNSYKLAKSELKEGKMPLEVVRRSAKEDAKIMEEEVD